jgi:hypothetical protein
MKRVVTCLAAGFVGGVVGLGLVGTDVAGAADRGTNLSDQKPEQASEAVLAAQDMALAQQLAVYGQENDDALALVVAAQIAGKYTPAAVDGKPRDDVAMPAGSSVQPVPTTADAMLAQARTLAGDRQDIVALIDDAAASATKGSTSGPGSYDGYIQYNHYVTIDEGYYGGQTASVSLDGSGTDLDLYIYDEYGNEICRSTTYGSGEYCSWTPVWTGPFSIVVDNAGNGDGYFVVRTN